MPYGSSASTDDQDAVMVLVGDTDLSDQLLDDDAYTMIIAQESYLYGRAALACDAIAGKYARHMRKRVGQLWRFAGQQYEHYRDLAQYYRLESARRGRGAPWAGGQSIIDINARRNDTDKPDSYFTLGMMDSRFATPLRNEELDNGS